MSTPLRRIVLVVQAIILVVVLYFGAAALVRVYETRIWGVRQAQTGADGRYLGIMEDGQLRLLAPQSGVGRLRLTAMAMQEARSPESAELKQMPCEGCLTLVNGRADSGWIYQARGWACDCGPSTRLVRWAFETRLPGLPF